MKVLEKELRLWNKIREEVEENFNLSNTDIDIGEFLLEIYKHKLKELRDAKYTEGEKNGNV